MARKSAASRRRISFTVPILADAGAGGARSGFEEPREISSSREYREAADEGEGEGALCALGIRAGARWALERVSKVV